MAARGMTSSPYKTETMVDTSAGTVRRTQKRIVVIEVTVDPVDGYDDDTEADYLITVNGRTVKRMTYYQAQRMGIVTANR